MSVGTLVRELYKYEGFLERIGAEVLSLMWTISEKVIIPDLP